MLTAFQQRFSRLLAWYGSSCPAHRGKWRIVNLGIRCGGLQSGYVEPVIATRRARTMELDLNSHIDQTIYYHGSYETWDTMFLETIIQPGWIMFDIGVNIGSHSLMASKHIGPLGRIYAFDISEEEIRKFQRNLDLNQISNVEPVLNAISDHPGKVRITETRDAGETSLALSGQTGREVNATTLDEFTSTRKITRLDIIKIDIEGAEVKFLNGGATTLKQLQPILMMELNHSALERFGHEVSVPVNILKGLGYRLFRCQRRGLTPLKTLPVRGEYFNVIALPGQLAGDDAPRDWAAVARLGVARG